MSREVRRVPADWIHPQRTDGWGGYQPMYDEDFASAAKAWREEFVKWYEPGGAKMEDCEWWEYKNPPDREYCRPAWPEESRTHWQMYETVSEGTPISPPMESPEALARWLADNTASAFAGLTATYEQWLHTIMRGGAVGAVYTPGSPDLISGVEYEANEDAKAGKGAES